MTREDGDIDAELQYQELQLIYRGVPVAQGVSVLNAALVAYVDASFGLPPERLWGWWGLITAIAAGRYALGRRFHALPRNLSHVARWRAYYLVGTGFIAAAWGLGGTLLLWHAPDTPVLFTALVLAGMVAGAIPLLAPVPRAFGVYATLLCLPLSARILLQADSLLHWVFGCMCLVYYAAMMTSARYLHRRIEAAIRLGLEKARLADTLSDSLEQLQQAQKQLLESEKLAALGGLVAGIAHEINTPVGVAVTAASMLEEESRTQAERYRAGQLKKTDLEQYLDLSEQSSHMILQNLARAAGLIHSFKQVAVDRSGEARRRLFDVRDYLEDVVTSLTPVLRKGGAACTVDCEPGLVVDSYPGLLAQVVTNLVMNAVMHGFEGRQGGHIRIAAHKANGALQVDVQDDGRGMAPEEVRRIFEPFFTTRRGEGGSGLGLYVVYNLVTQTLRGQIACRSVPGQGSTFTLSWPL